MQHDGNGWTCCEQGHQHWGRHGAAGLLLHAVDDAGGVRVLLQHRAGWSHHGDTWGLPGGARDSHEDAVAAALREAAEETGLDPAAIRTRHLFADEHGGWSYTTVYADLPAPVATCANHESNALEWVPLAEVAAMPLHPGFAATWDQVRLRPAVVLVDAANVVGSRPDGWWRDRAGASERLLARLSGLRAAVVAGPAGDAVVIAGVVAVLEGAAARAVAESSWVGVHRADPGGSGDDALVGVARALLADGGDVIAVSADRGLRERWAAIGADRGRLRVVGPRWLLGLLDAQESQHARLPVRAPERT